MKWEIDNVPLLLLVVIIQTSFLWSVVLLASYKGFAYLGILTFAVIWQILIIEKSEYVAGYVISTTAGLLALTAIFSGHGFLAALLFLATTISTEHINKILAISFYGDWKRNIYIGTLTSFLSSILLFFTIIFASFVRIFN